MGDNHSNKIIDRVIRFFVRSEHVNWALVDQALVSGVNFLTGILLARFLGLEEFGRFTLVWMAVLFFNSFQSALIISPMMSIGPMQKEEDEASYYGAVMVQQFVFILAGFILFGAGCVFLDRWFPEWGLNSISLPLTLVLVAFQLQEFLRRYFFTVKRLKAAFINDVISYLGQLSLLVILFFSTGLNMAMVLWVIAITSGLAAAVGMSLLGDISIEEKVLRQVIQRHWLFSKWLVASTLMQWLSGNYLVISAGAWIGVTAVGALKAAQNIVGVSHILFNALSNFVPIQLGKIYAAHGLIKMERYLFRVSLLGSIATLVLLAPAFLFPEFLLELIYSREYQGFGWVLFSYGAIYLFLFINQQLTFALRALEETRPVFLGYLFTGLISVLIAYPLLSTFKLAGVMAGLLLLVIINLVTLLAGYQAKRKEHSPVPHIENTT